MIYVSRLMSLPFKFLILMLLISYSVACNRVYIAQPETVALSTATASQTVAEELVPTSTNLAVATLVPTIEPTIIISTATPSATPLPPTVTPTATETPIPPTSTSTPTITPIPPTVTPAVTKNASPEIISFTSSAYEVTQGAPFTLTWQTTGEETSLCYKVTTIVYCYPMPTSGSKVLTETLASSKFYTIISKANGSSAREMIEINFLCPYVWDNVWQAAGNIRRCPGKAYQPSLGAIQHFEHGVMIWLEEADAIFVFGDKYPRYGKLAKQFEDTWVESMPEYSQVLTPPSGYYQPKRGFGLVWEMEKPNIRELLGWAIEPASNFEGGYQCYQHYSKYALEESCFILGPENIYFTQPYVYKWEHWPR